MPTNGACGKFESVFRERNEMDQQQPVQGQVQIKADEKELQGQYSNLVMIHHNLEEFTMNFIYIFPNGTQGKLLNSMILSPGHAKRIWRALGENLARYEAQSRNHPKGARQPQTSALCSRGWIFSHQASVGVVAVVPDLVRLLEFHSCSSIWACSSRVCC